jgi:CS domain
MLKRLPLNQRASQYAYQAGFNPPPQFYGDVYIGRIEQKTYSQMKNISFRLGIDTALDAVWLQAAVQENLTYQKDMNEMTGQKDRTQPLIAGQDGNDKVEQNGLYSWTQTEGELEVVVPLPNNTTTKDIMVRFHLQSLQVSYQKQPKVNINLFERIDIDAGTWTLEKSSKTNLDDDNKRLIISMEKLESAFWPRIVD